MATSISKQEMRRNPLAEWIGQSIRFIQGHQMAMIVGSIVIAVGVSVGAAVWWQHQRREDAASRLLATALAAAQPEQPGSTPKPEESVKALQQVVKEYPNTPSAEEALLSIGNDQYATGKIDDALATFDQYLKAFPRGRFRVMAALGKAYAQEAKGDFQGAAQTLSQTLERSKDNPLDGEVYMSLGRVNEELKKPDDAMKVYGQVVEKYPQTRWAQDAMQRMTALKPK